MFRRKFVKAASGTALAGLVAGCGGGGNGGGGDGGGGNGGGADTTTTEEEPIGEETPEETPMGETPAETAAETETPAETGTAAEQTINVDETIGEPPQGLEVTEARLVSVNEGDVAARLTGVIENTGDKTYEELEVQATLFDANDEITGKFFANTEGEQVTPFEPGEQWEFTVDFPRESADIGNTARYRLDVDADIDQSVWNGGSETTSA